MYPKKDTVTFIYSYVTARKICQKTADGALGRLLKNEMTIEDFEQVYQTNEEEKNNYNVLSTITDDQGSYYEDSVSPRGIHGHTRHRRSSRGQNRARLKGI